MSDVEDKVRFTCIVSHLRIHTAFSDDFVADRAGIQPRGHDIPSPLSQTLTYAAIQPCINKLPYQHSLPPQQTG